MTTTDTAKDQARLQLEHIKELMARLEHARECDDGNECAIANESTLGYEYCDEDAAQQAIDEKPLSVAVRGGWYNVSSPDPEDLKPVEYCILLCTGGPAVRIIGELDNYSQPDTARLEYQDWGTPWTQYREDHPTDTSGGYSQAWNEWENQANAEDDLLLSFARCFYYGD